MWAGIAGGVIPNDGGFEVSISVHDSVYNTDFASSVIQAAPGGKGFKAGDIEDHILQTLSKFASEHVCKFLGAGVTLSLLKEVRIQLLSRSVHH